MDYIKELKADFETAYKALPRERQVDLEAYYSSKYPVMKMLADVKREAESLLDWADRKGYGIGEIGYNINEHAKSFGEEVPELEKIYRKLLSAYIDFIDESKHI